MMANDIQRWILSESRAWDPTFESGWKRARAGFWIIGPNMSPDPGIERADNTNEGSRGLPWTMVIISCSGWWLVALMLHSPLSPFEWESLLHPGWLHSLFNIYTGAPAVWWKTKVITNRDSSMEVCDGKKYCSHFSYWMGVSTASWMTSQSVASTMKWWLRAPIGSKS